MFPNVLCTNLDICKDKEFSYDNSIRLSEHNRHHLTGNNNEDFSAVFTSHEKNNSKCNIDPQFNSADMNRDDKLDDILPNLTSIQFNFIDSKLNSENYDVKTIHQDNSSEYIQTSSEIVDNQHNIYEEPKSKSNKMKNQSIENVINVGEQHYKQYFKCCYYGVFCSILSWLVTVVIIIIMYMTYG